LTEGGFPDWTEKDFKRFVYACEKFGRKNVVGIAEHVSKSEYDIARYSKRFFKSGELFGDAIKQIEKGMQNFL
jgi:hypothetical protein